MTEIVPARYRRSARLTKTAEFSAVFAFRCVVRCSHFSVFSKPGLFAPADARRSARLGMSVGRKVAARAVDRNYMKRVIREVFRRYQGEFGGLDFIVALRGAFGPGAYSAIEAELLAALDEAGEKCRASCKA